MSSTRFSGIRQSDDGQQSNPMVTSARRSKEKQVSGSSPNNSNIKRSFSTQGQSAKIKTTTSRNKGSEDPEGGGDGDSAKKKGGVEKELTHERLRTLQKIFEDADEDCGGGLDMDEFRIAMRKALGAHLTDQELDAIFMKVDTNCDGTVDWDEYLSYMLLEYREKDQMNFVCQAKPFPKNIRRILQVNPQMRNRDSVMQITYMPNVTKSEESIYRVLEDSCGKYVTATKAGLINFWTADMRPLKNFRILSKHRASNTGVWVTGLVCMPNLNLCAVATTTCEVAFYDLTAEKFDLLLEVVDLEIAATCMDYWYDIKQPYKARLFWGDARGNISSILFEEPSGVNFFQPSINKNFRPKVPFQKLLRGYHRGLKAKKLTNVHDDFVVQVRFVPALHGFISCSKSGNTSLFHGDLAKKKSIYFQVRKGIISFDYSCYNNVIISGGKDAVVRVWNPYVPKKPVMLLHGHKTPIHFVMVHDSKDLIISISEDKEVNVFDMATQNIIQTIYRKWVPLGPRPISAVYFNRKRQALIMATNQIGIFEHGQARKHAVPLTSHKMPVNCVLYNSLFNQVVSGGADSLVCVWDIATGERLMQFNAHKVQQKDGEEVEVEITKMRFDPTQRRLATAARDGTIKIWNFNNGALLRELTGISKEITGLLWYNQRIFAAGWNQHITTYIDDAEHFEALKWPKNHEEDIHDLAFLPPSTLASASYDGNIYIWSVDSHSVLNRLNVFVDSRPCLLKWKLPAVRASMRSLTDKSGDHSMNRQSARRSEDRGSSPRKGRSKNATQSKGDADGLCSKSIKFRPVDNDSKGPGPEAAIERLIFLETRPTRADTASLVSIDALGWIRFWSVHHDGGLIGQFNAAHSPQEGVLAVCTDPDNFLLITGDTQGYIRTWDIADYCYSDNETDEFKTKKRETLLEGFPLLKECDMIKKKAAPDQTLFGEPPKSSNPDKTWHSPPVLNSFRGHLSTITCLDYVHDKKQLISASVDCTIRLWTIHGIFVGILGHETPWGSFESEEEQRKKPEISRFKRVFNKYRLPADVRRVASATTLRVFQHGQKLRWRLAQNIIMVWLPLLKKKGQKLILPRDAEDRIDTSKPQIPEDKSKPAPDSVEEPPTTLDDDEVLDTYQVPLPKKTVIGVDYKTTRKHHPLPKLKKCRHFQTQVGVYSSLPFHELDGLRWESLQPPQCVVDMQERQRLVQSLCTQTGRRNRTGAQQNRRGRPGVNTRLQSSRRLSTVRPPSVTRPSPVLPSIAN